MVGLRVLLEVPPQKKKKKKKKTRKKERKRKAKKKKRKEKKRKEEKRRVPRRAISAGHRVQDTTPHAINGLVEVKKASFLPSSTNPYGLAHTGSLTSNNGCARVAGAQS
jgi:outer membrane biosynthesis protein TonB